MKKKFACSVTCIFFALVGLAQVGTKSSQPAAAPPAALPPTTQIKKTVLFIQTNCLSVPSLDALMRLSPAERSAWSDESLNKLNQKELAKMQQYPVSGTGFLVYVPDQRLGPDQGFDYLITNRHVAQPGIEENRPCRVVSYSLFFNHKDTAAPGRVRLQAVTVDQNNPWTFPDDPSVDLAATPISISTNDWDFETIPLTLFATGDQLVEGDPVLFAGLFVQYSGQSRLEPIVRSGSIAMLPSDLIDTTLHKPGHIYLSEAHAFAGNSGSPMFVDLNKFKGGVGYDYRFLGVVTGEIFESADLSLQVTTSHNASVKANSDISEVVPADEVKKLLLCTKLQGLRDEVVRQKR